MGNVVGYGDVETMLIRIYAALLEVPRTNAEFWKERTVALFGSIDAPEISAKAGSRTPGVPYTCDPFKTYARFGVAVGEGVGVGLGVAVGVDVGAADAAQQLFWRVCALARCGVETHTRPSDNATTARKIAV
jgi:hypothetical protein